MWCAAISPNAASADGAPSYEVLGLVARRQAALWSDWRPWIAVIAIVVPIGLMLSYATRWWADAYAIDIQIYTQLWDISYLKYPGWPRELALVFWSGTLSAAALAGWSWASGYVLASLSRRTVWISDRTLCADSVSGHTRNRDDRTRECRCIRRTLLRRRVSASDPFLSGDAAGALGHALFPACVCVSLDARDWCCRTHCADSGGRAVSGIVDDAWPRRLSVGCGSRS